jgi:hypothetical protein
VAIVKKFSDFPGSKTFEKIYNSIPGSALVKNIVLAVGAIVIAAVVTVGIISLGGAFVGLLAAPLLVKIGVLTAVAGLFIAAKLIIPFAFRFDWNISDKKIAAAMKTQLDAMYEPFGEFLGSALGFFVCGALPGALAFAFSPAVAYLILKEVGEEAYEELMPQAANLARMAAKSYANALALQAFGSARKWIKRPGTPFHNVFKDLLGEKNLKRWGEQDDAPFILNNIIEERIEKIDENNKSLTNLKNFTEGAWEGFTEGCGEGSNIVRNGLTDQLALAKLARGSGRSVGISASF